MSFMTSRVFPLTIPNGTAVSNVLKAREAYEDALYITLYAPAVLDALTFSFDVTADPDAAAPVFVTLQVGIPPADDTPPPITKARQYPELIGVMGFRIKASGNVAADRIWLVTKTFRSLP